MSKDIIVIKHNVLDEISDHMIKSLLSKSYPNKQHEIIPVCPERISQDEEDIDWLRLKKKQSQIFHEKIKPKLEESPDADIIYFGLAPIPLAIHLGFLLNGWREVTIAQRHHATKKWRLMKGTAKSKVANWKIESNAPKTPIDASGSALIRMETSKNVVHIQECLLAIRNPIFNAYVHNSLGNVEDPFTSNSDLRIPIQLFGKAIDGMKNASPSLDAIHLFASVQCGVAFLMGHLLYPTGSFSVVCYHYKGRYIEAFPLHEIEKSVKEFSIAEKELLSQKRQKISAHFENEVVPYIKGLAKAAKSNFPLRWYQPIFLHTDQELHRGLPENPDALGKNTALYSLKGLWMLNLKDHEIETRDEKVHQSHFFQDETWHFRDEVLWSLTQKMPADADLLRAVRLIIFSESIHYQGHNLRPELSQGKERFPKILEELAYQADMYAIVNEMGFTLQHAGKEVTLKERAVFLECYKVLIKIFWAFVDLEADRKSMESHMLHRILTWVVQEHLIKQKQRIPLHKIVAILESRPLIELDGLKPAQDKTNRYLFKLNPCDNINLRLAMIIENKFKLIGSIPGSINISNIVDGLYTRDIEKIEEEIRAIVAHVQN